MPEGRCVQDGRVEGDVQLTLPHEHIKIHEYVEQLLLKTTWRWTERLLYNQGCKERPMWSQVGRKEKQIGEHLLP